ncbi:MAG: hypothetical protein PVH68_19350, partial [Armatimonadota bacterium]
MSYLEQVRAVFGDVVPGAPINVPEMAVDLPPHPRPWDTDDAALVEAVRQAGGMVTIGFKEAGSAPLLATGRRAAVSAATITAATAVAGMHVLEILYEYRSIGAILARIDAEAAPRLRDHPLVDYVEPAQQFSNPASMANPTPDGAPGWATVAA